MNYPNDASAMFKKNPGEICNFPYEKRVIIELCT
jgi:hypothetical protein